MKNIIRSTLLLFFMLLLVYSCNDDHIKKDMVEFDRAFIPVLYYVTLGDLKSAETAMYPLTNKWQHFQSIYHVNNTRSEDWNETVRMIGAWLDEASCAIQEKDAYRALTQLDHARYELIDLRIREDIDDYYLDYLWDLEASMYVVIEVANDPMIDLLEFNEFEVLSDEVEAAWLSVLHRPFDKGLIEYSPDQLRYINDQKDKLTFAVVSLMLAVESADRCQFADAALAMEPAYLNYLAMFGDFKALDTFYALKQ